jgi:hypothetical protein
MLPLFLDYYPRLIAVVFLFFLLFAQMPAKGWVFLRALTALVIAVSLAHLNRWFGFYPAHLLFPSGHTTFCLGMSISLGMLRPWTLAVTLPILIPFGMGLVTMHYHETVDVLGAIPLVLVVYGVIHWIWRLPRVSPPLDMTAESP